MMRFCSQCRFQWNVDAMHNGAAVDVCPLCWLDKTWDAIATVLRSPSAMAADDLDTLLSVLPDERVVEVEKHHAALEALL